MGATATGKSALGVHLALRFDGEVISMDSRQVYRGLDIGTGKVTSGEQGGIPHHLLDVLDPSEPGSAGRHADLALSAIDEIAARGRLPLLVGGTGLYFDAVFRPLIDVEIPPERIRVIRSGFGGLDTPELYGRLQQIDPARAEQLSPNDRVRITRALEVFLATGVPMSEHIEEQSSGDDGGNVRFLKLVLTMPRDELRQQVARRTRAMFDAGWVGEVRRLLESGCAPDSPGMQSLGYEEIAAAFASDANPAECEDGITTRTQQYAKRQETYFRGQKDAVWLDVTADDYPASAESLVGDFLNPA